MPAASAAAPAGVSTGRAQTGHRAAAAGSAAFDWPEFHQTPTLRGYAQNSPLSTANAGSLGVHWAANLYGAALDSPVVAYDPALKKTLAYVGTENGDMIAVNVANGQIVWATWLGSPIRTTPAVSGGAVYAGTVNSARIYKLNASTGAIDCSVPSPQPIEGTPVIATPPGGVRSLYVGTNDSISATGPTLAINAGNCKREWTFTGYNELSGSWVAFSYAVDAKNRPLVLFGTADRDAAVYAVNAVTGKKVWRFAVDNPPPGVFDVATGSTVSPPGKVTADGIAYVATKFGIMYALDLTTGKQVWNLNFNKKLGVKEGGRSTAALDGGNLVFGYNGGVLDVTASGASAGSMKWNYQTPGNAEALSSPAIAGAPGSEVVAVGDLGGGFEVLSLASGAQLYRYQTGGYITASPAVSGGNILITSADGFLYDFAAGGGNDSALPKTAISAPADNSSLANPDGNLTVKGGASDAANVKGVVVAVQEGGPGGRWWDAAAHRWVFGPIGNPAVLGPGTTSRSWRFSYPVPAAGGTYNVIANAVSSSGQADIQGAQDKFAVRTTTKGPHITASPVFVAPGNSTVVEGGGFASSEKITISLLGTTLMTTRANSRGNIPRTTVAISPKADFGQTSLTAKGRASGRSATVAVTIANNWDQVGYGHGHTSFEPNDRILFDLVHPGTNIFVKTAWRYQSGAPVNTAPAIADAVAYIANSAGHLTAIDVHNGAPMWTWKLPSGTAIDGSPAVDPAKRRVFVGADDGTVDAVNTATGKRVWSAQVGGHVSAPVYAGGTLYVTSSKGTVEALSEGSGKKLWAKTLPSPVSAAPSVRPAAKAVIVGESNGDVVALATGSGAKKWAFHSGGAVNAPVAVFGGTAYFGSANGSVYAVKVSSGAKMWSFPTGGPVTDTPAVTSDGSPGGVLEVLVGSGDGNVYALTAANGSPLFKQAFGQPIVGVAAVRGVVILDTSTGLIGATRSYANLDLWKFQTSAGITAPPAIVDGTVYVGAGDGTLYAFTSYGQLPGSPCAHPGSCSQP